MRFLRTAFSSAIVVGLAACSLFTDFSGLDEPPAEVPDALADSPAPTNDDASSSDAGTRPDAPSVSDTGASSSCPEGSFCDDFDDGGMGDKWTALRLVQGNLAFDTTDFQSAPRSLRSTVTGGNTDERTASLHRSLPFTKGVRCTFQVRINSDIESSDYIDIFQVTAAAPPVNAYQLRLYFTGKTAAVREDFMLADGGCLCPKQESYFNPLPRKKWTKVVFETDFEEARAYFDDALVFKAPYTGFVPTSMGVVVGIDTDDPLAWDVQYDDLRCDPL